MSDKPLAAGTFPPPAAVLNPLLSWLHRKRGVCVKCGTPRVELLVTVVSASSLEATLRDYLLYEDCRDIDVPS
jgi:hypothetical protein